MQTKAPLVEILKDGVRCNLCGREFSQIGTHMARAHGLPVHKRMGTQARLELYGLPEGSRLSSPRLREIYRNNLLERGGLEGVKMVPGSRACDMVIRDRPRSETQGARDFKKMGAAGGAKSGAAKRVKAAQDVICCVCAKGFVAPRHQHRTACSRKCALIRAARAMLSKTDML